MTGASGAPPPDLSFRPASSRDAETISRLAREIWTAVYSEMISAAQLKYMLEWMYAPDTLRREIADQGVSYFFIDLANDPAGYLAFSSEGSVTHLHKIYLKPEFHGRRFGSTALAWLADHCSAAGAESIRLRVNKANASAIRAYEKNNFLRIDSVCVDIGGGFVMDDYIYARSLK